MDELHAIDRVAIGGIGATLLSLKTYDPRAVASFAGHFYSRGNFRRYTKQDHMAKKKRIAKRRMKG